jgi:murein DD-endopeptidase MepM/ murein hydrolase activator NlpD
MLTQHYKVDKQGNKLYLPLPVINMPSIAAALKTPGAHRFNSRRANGRAHAGFDLYGAVGTEIYSMSSGKVIKCGLFYKNTFAIEIEHSCFVARYCELKPLCQFKPGDIIKPGELIGSIVSIDGLNQTMLHLEIYGDEAQGALTNLTNPPFFRRIDLTNPEGLLTWLIS